jgi:hypothetical protein
VLNRHARRAGRSTDALLWERCYAPAWIAGGGVTSSGARLPR